MIPLSRTSPVVTDPRDAYADLPVYCDLHFDKEPRFYTLCDQVLEMHNHVKYVDFEWLQTDTKKRMCVILWHLSNLYRCIVWMTETSAPKELQALQYIDMHESFRRCEGDLNTIHRPEK